MDSPPLLLAAGFPASSRGDWLALVEKTLKGAAIETLASHTPDGLATCPLYTGEDAVVPAAFPPAPRGGDPAWDIRAAVAHPDPVRANAQILEALAGGAVSVLVTIDPTGGQGVAVGTEIALARLLEGVMLDVAPIALDAGFMGPVCAGWLGAAAKASPAAPLAFHLDPLSAWAAAGASPGPIDAHLGECANFAARVAETYPRASLFTAAGRVVHEAGGSPAVELAIAAAAALAYAKLLVEAGMPMHAAFSRVVLCLSVDGDVLASIAKLRAARLLWAKMVQACGVTAAPRIEARSSGRMLTRAAPWINLVRLTAAGFAAATGGADAIVLGAFTDALGLPTPLARRLARNTQLILMQEAHVGEVADPFGGAWAAEALTDALARAAWAQFTAIEASGGIVAALASGAIAKAVESDRPALKATIATGQMRIVGVTDFVGKETTVEVERAPDMEGETFDTRLRGPDSRCPPLTPIRLEALAR